MSPTLYNRGGNQSEHQLAGAELRQLIKQHKLHSQEQGFIPSSRKIFSQWQHNRFKCVARNVDLFVSSSGDYLYCYNDVGHQHPIGNVDTESIRDILRQREKMAVIAAPCDDCNMRDRYSVGELAKVGVDFRRSKWPQPLVA